MPLRMGALYDALIAGNIPEEQARKAAEEVAGFDTDMHGVRADLTTLRGEVNLLKWMVGTNVILTVGVLGRLLFVH